jgi:hypothetical protein
MSSEPGQMESTKIVERARIMESTQQQERATSTEGTIGSERAYRAEADRLAGFARAAWLPRHLRATMIRAATELRDEADRIRASWVRLL